MKEEKVNHPSHYGGEENPYEVYKVLEAWGLDKDFYLGNAVKYIARAGKKRGEHPVDEYKKASWYLNRRITTLDNSEKKRHNKDKWQKLKK